MSTSQILTRAAARIRRAWCQGNSAKDQHGYYVPPKSTTAVSWCALGAIMCEGGSYDHVDLVEAQLRSEGDARSAPSYNDAEGRTAEEVAALLERAALEAK